MYFEGRVNCECENREHSVEDDFACGLGKCKDPVSEEEKQGFCSGGGRECRDRRCTCHTVRVPLGAQVEASEAAGAREELEAGAGR